LTVELGRNENRRILQNRVGAPQVLHLTLELLESRSLVRGESGRERVSTWVLRTQVLSVSGEMPKGFEIPVNAARSDRFYSRLSITILTARSRSSDE
jgi:hypothetical protein